MSLKGEYKDYLNNKKAVNLLSSNTIFVILVIACFAITLFFVFRIGSGVSLNEEIYAKKLGLIIDSMQPGTELILDITEIYDFVEKIGYDYYANQIIQFNTEKSILTVTLDNGEGYSFNCFTKLNQDGLVLDSVSKTLTIKV